MKISRRDWNEYSEMLAKLSRLASDEMQTFLDSHGIGNTELIVDVAHALVTKYGEASAAAACNLYDEIAEKQGKAVRPAEPAETASREKTAGAVYGSLKDSPEGKKLKQVPDRLVKQAAADTMLQNAKRDGAEWAWIPSGDGCAMCMTIASRGWLPASSAQLSGGHASHIHANCKCQFAIRFDKNLNVEGYDPDELKRQYDAAEGSGSRQKINYLRRKQYEKKANNVKSDLIKNIDIDDLRVAAYNKDISDEVIDLIGNTVLEGEKKYGFFISNVSVMPIAPNDHGGVPLMQIEPIDYGKGTVGIKLNINQDALAGMSLEKINNRIKKSKSTMAQTLEEAVWHECGHAKMISGKSSDEIRALYSELSSKGVHGISTAAEEDGAEALAEAEIFIHRNERMPEELKKLYLEYNS